MSVAVALLAAFCFSAAVVIQQKAAQRVGASLKLVITPLWLFGGAVDLGGFLLQLYALHLGSVVEVQVLQVSVLPFGLLLGRVRLPWEAWVSVAAVGGGLAGIILFANPRHGVTTGHLVPAVVAVAVLVGVILLVTRGDEIRSAVGSALAASVLFATTATTGDQLGNDLAAHGVGGMLTRPAVYLTAVVSATGLTLAQRAYAKGPLALNLVVLTLLDPLASLALGVVVAGDRLRGGRYAAGAIACAVVTAVGVVVLAREEAKARRAHAAAQQQETEPAAT